MNRFAAVLLASLLAAPLFAQDPKSAEPPATFGRLASAWDMDGEAADPDQVVTAANGIFADNKTDYTITAQPDSCRLLDITVEDTDMSAGTLTISGLDCLGSAKTCSWSATAGNDDGIKTLTCTDGTGAYFSSVTGVATGAMTGESDETFTLGYTTNSAEAWPMYGVKFSLQSGAQGVDPYSFYTGPGTISTSGISTTVGGTGAFAGISVGDMIFVLVEGRIYGLRITAKASDNSVTVSDAINIPAAVGFRWQKFYVSTNPKDQMWVRLGNYTSLSFLTNVDANASTGGVVVTPRCYMGEGFGVSSPKLTIPPTTIATGAPASEVSNNFDARWRYSYCKLGFNFGTGDDADAAPENITASFSLGKFEAEINR